MTTWYEAALEAAEENRNRGALLRALADGKIAIALLELELRGHEQTKGYRQHAEQMLAEARDPAKSYEAGWNDGHTSRDAELEELKALLRQALPVPAPAQDSTEHERHADDWHEWSIDTSSRKSDGSLWPSEMPRRMFLHYTDNSICDFVLTEADVTSENPGARELKDGRKKRFALTASDAHWLCGALAKALVMHDRSQAASAQALEEQLKPSWAVAVCEAGNNWTLKRRGFAEEHEAAKWARANLKPERGELWRVEWNVP